MAGPHEHYEVESFSLTDGDNRARGDIEDLEGKE